MSDSAAEFSTLMRAQGLIPSDAPMPPADTTDRPWFVSLLQGVAGWLAGIFLLVFLGLVFKPESGPMIFALGAVLLVAAWFMYHADRHGAFLDQLSLAISIAGQIAVAVSVLKDNYTGLSISATALVVQIFVLLIMPNKIARTLAALFATIAWVYTIRFLVRPGHADRIFFEDQYAREVLPLGEWTLPLAWLLTWLPLLALAAWLILREPKWMASGLRRIARPLLTGLLSGLAIGAIAAEPFTVVIWGAESWGRGIDWLAIFPLLSIGLTLFAAYGAFRVRSNGLLGFAVFAALVHLSRFYYLYGTTLMWKSVIMLVVGAALLLASVVLRNRQAGSGEAA
jgi:Domain of unknown function (DUF4401)